MGMLSGARDNRYTPEVHTRRTVLFDCLIDCNIPVNGISTYSLCPPAEICYEPLFLSYTYRTLQPYEKSGCYSCVRRTCCFGLCEFPPFRAGGQGRGSTFYTWGYDYTYPSHARGGY